MTYLWKNPRSGRQLGRPAYSKRSPESIDGLSVVVPTLNEEGNVRQLVHRLDQTLSGQAFPYELIFIDDHSEDGTWRLLTELAQTYPLTVRRKRGRRGKAYSLLEGFEAAKYNLVAMIDADLQYPPEALPNMIEQIKSGHNVVVANRRVRSEPWLRRLSSRLYSLLFTGFLHGFTCDVQAGLKLFRRQVLDEMELHPTGWTFDLAFLVNAREAGHTIGTVDITFDERTHGASKVRLLRDTFEIGFNALALKFRRKKLVVIPPRTASSMLGAGVAKRGRRYITHTTLRTAESAFTTFTAGQRWLLLAGLLAVVGGFLSWPLPTAVAVVSMITIIYFLDAVFNLYLVRKSVVGGAAITFSPKELAALDATALPRYSILCPLYREANMISGFVKSLENLDWPKEKLDVLLLLEQDDTETIQAAKELALPSYIRVVIVPDSQPKTKPKACNYGLTRARGEYVVIYDAEDIPDPQQLKKAHLAWQRVPSDVRCLQAKLNYFNSAQNVLTRFFTAEYSQWFDVMLPGMQSVNTIIPLGGTSNHFKMRDLRALEGWDPFNVTEDCDLGARLFKRGYRCAIIDSVTMEEANSQVGNWLRQRSRWLKGYMQTYLVHMRRPIAFFRRHGWHALSFQFIVGGKVAFMAINPLLWLATISYFAAYGVVGPSIEAVYPQPVLWLGVSSLIFGNFLYLYYYMIGCAARGQWRLIKYVYLIPLYWLLASVAAYVAFYQLLTRPHYWEKTRHGLHREPANREAQKVARQHPRLRPASGILSSDLFSQGSLLLGAMIISNALNFGFNAFLGRVLGFAEISLVVLINTLWQVATLVLAALSTTVNHRVAYLVGAHRASAAAAFWKRTTRAALLVAAAFTGVWILLTDRLAAYFNMPEASALLLLSPIFTFGVVAFMNRGWLHGNLRFGGLASLFLIESGSKFLLAAIVVWLGWSAWVYTAIPLSVATVAVASLVMTRQIKTRAEVASLTRFPRRFFSASVLTGVAAVAFLNLDVVLAQHYLAAEAAGQYALLSLVGKMIYFLGALPNIFTVSLVSRDEGKRQSTAAVFRTLMMSTTLLVGLGFLGLGLGGAVIVPYLFGAKAQAIVPWLLAYTLAISLFTLANSIVTYHLARRHFGYPVLLLFASAIMVGGIVRSHSDITDIVSVILSVSLAGFVAVATMHLLGVVSVLIRRGGARAVGQRRLASLQTGVDHQRILVFNWRDMRHVMAGGAEVHIQRMAEEWVAQGHEVTIFCGNDGRSPRQESVRGVQIIRRGGFYLVYGWAVLYYLFRLRGKFDVVVDCHNGIPFFTPFYVRRPVFCLMHHVHQEVFRRSLAWPLAQLARWLERAAMPLVYRRVPIITISQSSKEDMEALGLGRAGIHIVHPGVDLDGLSPGAKSIRPLVLYLGRLAPYKSVDVLVRAFMLVLKDVPKARLLIAGRGEDETRLRALVEDLHLERNVALAGHVTERRKAQLLRRAWVMVNPSFMEGWGITTIEANASGTPVVASNVGGLRDSIRDTETGLLVPYGDVQALANSLQALLNNRYLRNRMGRQAMQWSRQFSFVKSSQQFLSIVTAELKKPARASLSKSRNWPSWRRGWSVLREAIATLAFGRFEEVGPTGVRSDL